MSFELLTAMLPALAGLGMAAGRSAPSAPEPEGDQPSFSEPHRPQIHYTPPRHWMNDPNGLVYHDGTYHLFHQYNPQANTWGHMSWYHATSPDLVHWTHRGVAIPEEGNEMIFSGSAVVDEENTAGFGDGQGPAPLVAIYTSHYTLEDGAAEEAQSLAYSLDGGATWTKYAGNPVLEHADPDFRDPNVFWYAPDETWLMAVALPTQHKIQFYASANLKEWTHRSTFGPAGATGGIWECPALFRVPVEGTDRRQWVLQVDLNPGSVAGGSGSQYFVGDFDGTTFTPQGDTTAPCWVDYGPDFYATIPWNCVPERDGRALWIGWMNNWAYAERIPTHPWRSAQSVPRAVALRRTDEELRLVQRPVEELQQLRGGRISLANRSLPPGTHSLADDGVEGQVLELVAEIAPGTADIVGLNVRAGKGERTTVGYDAGATSVFVDRPEAGIHDVADDVGPRHTAPLGLRDGRVTLHVLVDRSSVEVFANDGARVLTHRIFPNPGSTGVSLFAEGGTAHLARLDAWPLRSIWTDP